MKKYRSAFLLIIVASLAIVACKKDHTPSNVIKLSDADADKTVIVSSGQTISLTLDNPADGGYQFDAPQYDTTVLHLGNHVYTPPADVKKTGSAGEDTFNFVALKVGTSALKISASRGKLDTISIFNNTILVQ